MQYTPLKMHPSYKEYLWGGTHLKEKYGKIDAPKVTAESWELAAHQDGVSTVETGTLAGRTLTELGTIDHDGFWGSQCEKEKFPILVKLIDASKDLSIQVHPSDNTAVHEYNEQGKAEMWYIVSCEPQAFIYYGFSEHITQEEFLKKAKDGSICDKLNKVSVKKGDVFYILPGTIHAIGAGIVLAEIQQNSNTTFRVYDYQRRGKDGKFRPLHLERAANVLNFEAVIPSECKANSAVIFPEFTMTEMFTCSYFRAYRLDVKTMARLSCDGKSFQHLLCVSGSGEIQTVDGSWTIRQGESYFLPAKLGNYTVKGPCRVLLSRI